MGLNVGESATTRAAQLLETCTRNGRGIKLDYRVKVEQSENLKNLVLFRNKYFVIAIQSSPYYFLILIPYCISTILGVTNPTFLFLLVDKYKDSEVTLKLNGN